MCRYLFWPPRAVDWSNPYLALFHAAMSAHGVGYCGDMADRSVGFLRANAGRYAGIHVHWPEDLWRHAGPGDRLGGWMGRARKAGRVAGFGRFLWAARQLGYKIVWTVHNAAPHEGAWPEDRVGYRLLGAAADVLVFHSEAARAEFGAGRRAVVMRMGSYAAAYPPAGPAAATRARFGVPAGAKLLVAAGLIRRYKGFDVAAAAAARLGPGYFLLVAGPPHDPAAVADVVAAAGPNVRVEPRPLTDQEFADVHAAADAVLLPYRKITGSSALMAAVSFGRGVVASDLPYFREYAELEPGFAELARPGDPADLSAAIGRYFATPAEARRAAAERLSGQCSWCEVTAPLAARLVGHPPAPPEPR